MKYQKEWDEGYEDGCKGITDRATEISKNLSKVSMPDLYYMRGNVVGQLRYIKERIAPDYTPVVDFIADPDAEV